MMSRLVRSREYVNKRDLQGVCTGHILDRIAKD